MKERFLQECRKVSSEVLTIRPEASLADLLRRTLAAESIKTAALSSRCDPALLETLGWSAAPVESADVGITKVDAAVAETGTLLISDPEELRLSLIPPIHIAIISEPQLVPTIDDVWHRLATPPRMFTLITGPSRTADIEKTLVLGAHGPRRLILCFQEMPRRPE